VGDISNLLPHMRVKGFLDIHLDIYLGHNYARGPLTPEDLLFLMDLPNLGSRAGSCCHSYSGDSTRGALHAIAARIVMLYMIWLVYSITVSQSTRSHGLFIVLYRLTRV